MATHEPVELQERWGLYSATYPDEWSRLQFCSGDIILTTLPMSFSEAEGVQGVFVVVGSFQDGAGGWVAQVRSLGSSSAEVTQKLSTTFNRRSGYLHFCKDLEECDYSELVAFHVRVFTLADPVGFHSEHVGPTGKKLLKQLLQDLGLDKTREEREEVEEVEEVKRKKAGDRPEKERPGAEEKSRRRERGKGGGDPGKLAASAKAGKPAHEELRKRLEALRKGQAPEGTTPLKEGEGGDRHMAVEASTFEEQLFQLNSGRRIPTLDGGLDEYLLKAQQDGLRDAEAIKRRSAEAGTTLKTRGNVGSQLALQASAREKRPSPPRGGVPGSRGGKKKKKKKKSSGKKKKAQKKSKKRHGRGGGPGGSSPSSSSSSGSGSKSNSSSSRASSSAESLLPPLQRRSRKEAGSVLRLLIRQVEEQLCELQGSDAHSQTLLGGTKLVSYYHLMMKAGGLQVNSRDGRELFLLANLIDLLRMGQLALLGDGLASRFLAIQQAQIDSNWIAARHLEIFTPEVMTAAGASMTLEARRHARLVDKAKGIQSNRSRNEGPYSGGAWRSSNWNSNPWDGYGDSAKGKGKKGKGKPKGGSGQGKGGGSWRGGSAWEPTGKGANEKEKNTEKEKEGK